MKVVVVMDWFEYLNVSGPEQLAGQFTGPEGQSVHLFSWSIALFLINFFLVHQTWPVNKGIETTIECVL